MRKYLKPNDFIVIAFYIFLSILNFIFYQRIQYFYYNLLVNCIIVTFIILISKFQNLNKTIIKVNP